MLLDPVGRPGHWLYCDTARGLLAACRAAPADPLPRLVLADFAEEQGGAAGGRHAGFVRWHCGAARPGLRVWTPSGTAGPILFDDAIGVDPAAVAPVLPDVPEWLAVANGQGVGVYYRMGLPEVVKCGITGWERHHELLGWAWGVPRVSVREPTTGFGVIPGFGRRPDTYCFFGHGFGVRDDTPPGVGHHRELVRKALHRKAREVGYSCPEVTVVPKWRWAHHDPLAVAPAAPA